MLRFLVVALVVCALSAEAQDGCTQSDCTTSSVRVLPGALPTCNYSRRGTIRQERDGGVYVCALSEDGGSAWGNINGSQYWYDGGSGAIAPRAARVLVPAGSAAAPSLALTNDTNTGLYSYGADQLGVAAGGVSALYFGAGYIVGNSANAALTINGSYSRLAWANSYVNVATNEVTLEPNTGYVTVRGPLRDTRTSRPVSLDDVDGFSSVGVAAASLPTCDSSHNGALQFDLTANKWRVCDAGGSSWHYLAQQWTFSGWLPVTTSTSLITVAQMVASVNGVVYSLHVKPPQGLTDRTGGDVVYTVYDSNSTTVLCTLTIACSAGSGSTTSCTGAVVAGNTLNLRVDHTGCTGGTQNGEANIVAGIRGGL